MMASSSMHQFRVHSQWIGRVVHILQSRPYSVSPSRCSISRMLDMGGAPGAVTSKNNVRVRNTSKNSKVQAVAFDFELLVKTIQDQEHDVHIARNEANQESVPLLSQVKPDVDRIKELASLLKVDIDSAGASARLKPKRSDEEDDLSALLGKDAKEEFAPKAEATSKIPSSLEDIRAKYANKLHKRGVEGGIAGVELAKHRREEALKRGDAEGHWAARKVAAAVSTQQSGSRWMALTGTGKLLSTLTYRSMKIALLPRPPLHPKQQPQDRSPNERMQDLANQLKDVVFDVLIDLPTNGSPEEIVQAMVSTCLKKLEVEAKVILFVSDQDSFLRRAKEMGMMTCRIQPLNSRRGNVTAHHTVESILHVHDVVNEMNGISFNAVLNM